MATDAVEFLQGHGLTEEQAKAAAEDVRRLCAAHGGSVTPEVLWEAARSKSSPLHSLFEWDRERAYREHNLNLARNIIRNVVSVEVKHDRPRKRRAFQSVVVDLAPETEPHRAYRRTDEVAAKPDLRDQVVAAAARVVLRQVERVRDLDVEDESWELIETIARGVLGEED